MTSNSMLVRASVALIAIACLGALAAKVAFSGKPAPVTKVVVASYGGAFQIAQIKAFYDPYTKITGTKVIHTSGSGYAKLKAMAESGNITWDVVSAESSARANEVKDNLLQPLDYSIIKADGIPDEYRTKYNVGYIKFAEVLAWSKDKFPIGVTPAQFFDPAVKGRRAVTLEPEYTLEFALLADGVKAAELYPLDVNRALNVVGRVKDQIVAYKGAADVQALIEQGEVDMAFVPSGRVYNAIRAGANWGYGWEASVSDTEWWGVAKGAPHSLEAMKFINFVVQPVPQAEFARQLPNGPTNVNALSLLEPSIAKDLPSYPDNARLGAVLNSQWWNENRESVKARWNSYIMQ
jgi:putative spermidine/putrescine transport system substrate-binding protein